MRTRQFWGCKCNHVVIHLSADLHDSLFCVNRICIFVCSMHGTEWWDLLKMPPAHFKFLQANVRGEVVKSSSILIYAECLAWYLLQTEKGKKNTTLEHQMFPVIQKFSLRDGMNQYSFTLKLPHVLLQKSADKCLRGSLWYWERMEERRGELAEWVTAARLLDVVLRPLSPLPACLCTTAHHLLYAFHTVPFLITFVSLVRMPNVYWILGDQSNGDHSTPWCSGAWHLRTHPVSVRNRETPESPEKPK